MFDRFFFSLSMFIARILGGFAVPSAPSVAADALRPDNNDYSGYAHRGYMDDNKV